MSRRLYLSCSTPTEILVVLSVFRRGPPFAVDDYSSAMNLVFWILMNISKDSLTELKTHHEVVGEKQLIFAGRICECLINLGSLNMQFIIADGNRATHFFEQVGAYHMTLPYFQFV